MPTKPQIGFPNASQYLHTGRFVLLPKNLVTGVAKARIVIVRPAGSDLIVATEAPAQSGLFLQAPQKERPAEAGQQVRIASSGQRTDHK
jgi:hypothetical protein